MFYIGTIVQVTDGEYHGKTGEIVAVSLKHNQETGAVYVYPVVRFKDDSRAEIQGNHLTVSR